MLLWCHAYGLTNPRSLIAQVKYQVAVTVRRRRRDGAEDAAAWRQDQPEWIRQNQNQQPRI